MCSKASVYKRQSSSNAFFWVDAFMKWQVNPASCCKYCSNNWGCKFVKMEAGKKSMTLRMILEMPKASLAWNIENNIFHLIKPYNYAQTRAYAWQVASFEYRRCKATPPPSMVYLEKWAKRFKYGHICFFRSVHEWAEHLNKVTA